MKHWKIFFIMWVSWAGKWTLIKNLKEKIKLTKLNNNLGENLDKNLNNNLENILFPLSCRSRKPRDWEIHWVDSFFYSKEEFLKKVKNNEFLEYELVHNLSYYWTLKKSVLDDWIYLWKNIIKEIDIKWLLNIYENNSNLKKDIISIFIDLEDEIIVKRAKQRDKISEEELKERINSVTSERKLAKINCTKIISWSNSEEEVLKEVLDILNFYK